MANDPGEGIYRAMLEDDDGMPVLGTSADDRSTSLQSLEAPDFSLPDLSGGTRTLSEHRGKKVMLGTWASW